MIRCNLPRWQNLAWQVTGCAAVSALVVLPCAAAGEAARNAPLRIGSVSSLTGPARFPESSAAVRAYFDSVNASGGIRGRQLELIVEDDKGDPAEARNVARRLVDEQGVLAMVGSASIVDCASNAEHYQRSDLMSIQGTGIEPECFASSHVVPVNTGPYLSLRNALQFARDTLKASRPCAIIFDLPGTRAAYDDVMRVWSRESGVGMTHVARFAPGDDVEALIRQATARQCDAVVHTGVEPMVLEWVRAAQRLGLLAVVPTIFLTPAYTERVATELHFATLPIYCMAEFEPWSSRSPSLTDWRSMMQRAKVPPSSFAQGGYVAAHVLVRTLRGIDGELTRQRVSAALRSVANLDLAMVGTRFSIGTSSRHNPNRAALPMKLERGIWRIASAFWVVAP
ncbi:MAG: ABC transporter substrate-binding protein [Pseudomonadota bacterium]